MNDAYLYLEHVTDDDLSLLIKAAGIKAKDHAKVIALLRHEPMALDQLLSHPAVYQWLFRSGDDRPYLRISPMVAFSVLVHRTARELADVTFVQEWTAPRQRLPVFAVEGMRRFLADRKLRFYLADLLASFTRVVGVSVFVDTPRGRRRQRYNELDPVTLASLALTVKGRDRSVIYRRLGDVALFLTGVFPDYTGRHRLRPVDLERLARVAQVNSIDLAAFGEAGPTDPFGVISLYEHLGQRWYRLAAETSGTSDGLLAVADQFREGRRILNYLADRHLHHIRCEWFPEPAA